MIRNVDDVANYTTGGPGLRALLHVVSRKIDDRISAERTAEPEIVEEIVGEGVTIRDVGEL